MRVQEHLSAYQEHRNAIFKWSLEIQGLDNSQRTIGLNASRGILELLSAFLHRGKLIDEGFQLNHRWFKSAKVSERLPDFANKAVDIATGTPAARAAAISGESSGTPAAFITMSAPMKSSSR